MLYLEGLDENWKQQKLQEFPIAVVGTRGYDNYHSLISQGRDPSDEASSSSLPSWRLRLQLRQATCQRCQQ